MVSIQPHLSSLHCAGAVAAVPQLLGFYFEVTKVPVILIDH